MGALLAGATVLTSRVLARRTEWARALHEALRPAVRDADGVTIACMAISSGVGEELLFRGLLVPLVGVVVSSIGFGLLHQVRGPARWVWAAWACGMGALFALVFTVTGSLAGGVLAHVAINRANLRFIRDVDPVRAGSGNGGMRIGSRVEVAGLVTSRNRATPVAATLRADARPPARRAARR